MNQFTFNSMIAAIRNNQKIEAIRLLRDAIVDNQKDPTGSNLKFCKDFIEALMPNISPANAQTLPQYRYAVAYKSFGKDAEYESHLSESEAVRRAEEILANPEFDIDYCHVVEMKHVARPKSVFVMKPFND